MANYNVYLLDKNGEPVFFKTKPDLTKGDLYISVSQILSMLGSGDFLINWALREFGGLADSVGAYRSYMDRVSDLGSKLHKYIEYDVKGLQFPENEVTEAMLPGIGSWHNFKNNHEIKLIDSELTVHSKTLRCAGQMDLRVEIDGVRYVADLKTGSVMGKAFIQLTAYKHMLQEMKLSDGNEKLLVLGGADSKSKISDGGAVQMHTLESFFKGQATEEDMFVKFMCLRELWYQENLRSKKFEPIIKGMETIVDPMMERFRAAFQHAKVQAQKSKTKRGVKKSEQVDLHQSNSK